MQPDWDAMSEEVARKLTFLRLAWEETAKGDPELHRKMAEDLYQPALRLLAEFCACIREEGES